MSLLSPLFLLGLAALAAPIIVHLVRRTRAPQVDFPSLMFVRRIPQRTIRRKRLHNLLLLLLRSLAVLLAVFAFSRPFFEGSQAEALGRDRANLILLDTSLSMRYGKRFEDAKTRAKAILQETAGERAALITFGQGFEVLSRFTTETEKIRVLVDQAQPGLSATAYEQALRSTEGLFAEAGKGEKRIFLISDFQATGRTTEDVPYRVPKDVKVLPIDVSEEKAPNLAIVEVGTYPIVYQQKYNDKMTIRIANYSDEERGGIRVEFNINDHLVEKREIRIPAWGVESVEFTGFNLNEGINRCLVTLGDDQFAPDNRFNFTIRRASQYKALIIETATRGQSESFYLRNALTTGENLPFALTVKTIGAVNPGEVHDYRVIVLNDPADMSDALASQLTKFVDAGGGVILGTGPHTRPEQYNRLLGAIAPTKLDELVQARSDFVTLTEIKTDHPIFEIFRQSGRLTSTRFFSYFRSTPREQSSVLARFADGAPALVESAHGKGKILFFASSLDSTWNDLPLSPIYLPLVRQAVRHLGEREEKAWQLAERPFTVPPAEDGSLPAVDTPAGMRLTDKTQTPLGDLIINPKETGFYRLRYPTETTFVAVDSDSRESDLRKLDVNAFIQELTGSDKTTAGNDPAAEPKAGPEELESRQRIWWMLLLAALILFVSEAIIARRMRTARIIN
jgi:hypothetical protein